MFMRVAGRPLDGFTVLPRSLLRHTAQVLRVPPPSIASLRSIYKRWQTLSKHQFWAKTYLRLCDLEADDEPSLTNALLHSHDVAVGAATHGRMSAREYAQRYTASCGLIFVYCGAQRAAPNGGTTARQQGLATAGGFNSSRSASDARKVYQHSAQRASAMMRVAPLVKS